MCGCFSWKGSATHHYLISRVFSSAPQAFIRLFLYFSAEMDQCGAMQCATCWTSLGPCQSHTGQTPALLLYLIV